MIRVAVIGAGLLGRTLADELTRRGVAYTVFGHRSIEVTDSASCGVLRDYDVALNTAAYHRLAECEAHPDVADAVNHRGAVNVGRVTRQVFVSTDYVVDDGPMEEVLPGTQPRSVYGRTKLLGELACLAKDGVVVRVASMFGHYRSHKGLTFPEVILSGRDPIKLPIDQRFSPTYAPDAAARIVDLALDSEKVGIYHSANAGSCSWYEFAENIIEVTGIARRIERRTAHDPLRPRNSVLRSTLLPPLRHWRIGLEAWSQRKPLMEPV